jgi:hypothetical protein
MSTTAPVAMTPNCTGNILNVDGGNAVAFTR